MKSLQVKLSGNSAVLRVQNLEMNGVHDSEIQKFKTKNPLIISGSDGSVIIRR